MIEGLIAIEGIDGSGKSTQAKLLSDFSKTFFPTNNKGKTCNLLFEREPTSGPVGKLIREILSGKTKVDHTTLEFLWAADRKDHVIQIKKEIEDNNIIVTDRYAYSAIAYAADNEAHSIARKLKETFFDDAEYLVFLDIPPEEAIKRLDDRSGNAEIYENISKLQSVHSRYMDVLNEIKDGPTKVIVINALQHPEKIHQEIIEKIHYFN